MHFKVSKEMVNHNQILDYQILLSIQDRTKYQAKIWQINIKSVQITIKNN